MDTLGLSATIDGSTVRVAVGGALAGTGRFTGNRIADYQGELLGETREAHEAALAALAERLLAQGAEEVEAMQREAYDEDGVDMSLIRWMLSLTPRERLRALDDHSRSLARVLGQ